MSANAESDTNLEGGT